MHSLREAPFIYTFINPSRFQSWSSKASVSSASSCLFLPYKELGLKPWEMHKAQRWQIWFKKREIHVRPHNKEKAKVRMWGLTKAVFSFLNGPRVFASTTRLSMLLSDYIWTSFDDHFGSRILRLSGHFSQRGMPTCSELDDIVERSFLFCFCFFFSMEN